MLVRTAHFSGAAFDLPRTFFLFLQHVFIRNIPNFFWFYYITVWLQSPPATVLWRKNKSEEFYAH